MDSEYKFDISLSVLNHLGRNLYRNFITIIGEAISNSWDADAKHVWIDINSDRSEIVIKDDGTGMTSGDFQSKFLNIGYSKRKGGCNCSANHRPFIGRKGIGKLALLSCSAEVTIITSVASGGWVGGTIDNSELDDAIERSAGQGEYHLKKPDQKLIGSYCNNLEKGTVLIFKGVNADIPIGDIGNIRRLIALYFRFSLIDEDFSICVNGSEVGVNDLDGLIKKTQFLWMVNEGIGDNDGLVQKIRDSVVEVVNIKTDDESIKGFIASARKPRDLAIFGSGERVGIDLFVNGRMRERNISRHAPKSRIPENYLYGQIHYNKLDSADGVDRFTSSREGVIANDKLFCHFMKDFDMIVGKVIDMWDKLRLNNGDDGDPDNSERKSKKDRASRSLFSEVIKEYRSNQNVSIVDQWQKKFADDAEFNFASYAECFVSENLVRELIRRKKYALDKRAVKEAEKWRQRERSDKRAAGISISIRANDEDLYYLPMEDLCRVASSERGGYPDKLINDNRDMVPIRNAIMHTSKLTNEAKLKLTTVFNNIRAKISQLIDSDREVND